MSNNPNAFTVDISQRAYALERQLYELAFNHRVSMYRPGYYLPNQPGPVIGVGDRYYKAKEAGMFDAYSNYFMPGETPISRAGWFLVPQILMTDSEITGAVYDDNFEVIIGDDDIAILQRRPSIPYVSIAVFNAALSAVFETGGLTDEIADRIVAEGWFDHIDGNEAFVADFEIVVASAVHDFCVFLDNVKRGYENCVYSLRPLNTAKTVFMIRNIGNYFEIKDREFNALTRPERIENLNDRIFELVKEMSDNKQVCYNAASLRKITNASTIIQRAIAEIKEAASGN